MSELNSFEKKLLKQFKEVRYCHKLYRRERETNRKNKFSVSRGFSVPNRNLPL